MNSIYEKQNDLHFLKCIAAQRKEYNVAKRFSLWKDIITVAFAVLSIIASCLDVDTLTAIVFFFAGIISLASKYVDKDSQQHKQNAAMTQQYVDVSLFNFVLKDDIRSWGPLLSSSKLAEIISIIFENDIKGTENWYSDYSTLSPLEQVYYCQKENLHWDTELRKEFKNLVLIFVVLIVSVILIAAFVINPTLIRLLCVASWMLPLIDYAYSYYIAIKKDFDRLDVLTNKCTDIEKTISKTDMGKLPIDSHKYKLIRSCLIELQYDIMMHREASFLIPDWFYKLRKIKYQCREDKIANEIQSFLRKNKKKR